MIGPGMISCSLCSIVQSESVSFINEFRYIIAPNGLGKTLWLSGKFMENVWSLFGLTLWSRGNFYSKPLAADAKNAVTVENNRNEVQLLLHDVYFIRSKIHRST